MSIESTGGGNKRFNAGGAHGVILAAILLPLFVQLQGSIYSSPDSPLLDSGYDLRLVPLPISLLACALGIVLLAGTRAARLSIAFVAVLGAGMIAASLAASGALWPDAGKAVLLAQFLAPLAGFVYGVALPARSAEAMPKSFFWVLVVFVSLELGLTMARGLHATTHDLVLFSVYQHRQFVPVVMECAYIVVLFALWRAPFKPALVVLGLAMSIYAAMSFSLLAAACLVFGVAVFSLRLRTLQSATLLALIVLCMSAVWWTLRDTYEFRSKSDPDYVSPYLSKQSDLRAIDREQPARPGQETLPLNVRNRFSDWVLYGKGVLESPRALLLGHVKLMSREVASSAHNYYLDFIYNFGVLAFLPLAGLLLFTCVTAVKKRHVLLADPMLAGICVAAALLIFVDSNFKVTLRQPYPGIFAFLLLGALLARLRSAPAHERR